MRRLRISSALPLLTIALIISPSVISEAKTPVQAPGALEARAKVVQLLEVSGYKYRKTKDNVWVIDYTGNQMANFQVIVTSAPDLMLAFVVVAEKTRMRPTAEFFYKLLKLAHDYDIVKVVLNGDDNLTVRIDSKLKSLDAEEFKAYIKQVAAASDEIYGQIKPMLSAK